MGIGASDMSGSDIDGQGNHASLILGEEGAFNRIYNKTGMEHIHMRVMSEKVRKQVIRNMDFSSDKVQCWCFHLGREQTEKELLNHSKLKKYRMPKVNIHKSFDKYWLRSFQDSLGEYLALHKEEISDLVIQTDADMSLTMKNWGMQNAHEGRVHELADAVAWCNQKEKSVKGCKVMYVQDEIRKKMYS